jgi:RNA polymerase sigma-70 factor (ECF subfamily)
MLSGERPIAVRLTAAPGEAVGRREDRAPDPDALLLARCRRGEASAFDALLERHRGSVLNLAYQMLGAAEEAQDAAQEVFVRAFTRLRGFRGDAAFATWLRRIAVNECINRLGRRGREGELPPELASARSSPDEGLAVRAAIQSLSPPLRAALVLRELHGASYQEIAHILRVPVGTVRSRLAAAREKLRELLREEA